MNYSDPFFVPLHPCKNRRSFWQTPGSYIFSPSDPAPESTSCFSLTSPRFKTSTISLIISSTVRSLISSIRCLSFSGIYIFPDSSAIYNCKSLKSLLYRHHCFPEEKLSRFICLVFMNPTNSTKSEYELHISTVLPFIIIFSPFSFSYIFTNANSAQSSAPHRSDAHTSSAAPQEPPHDLPENNLVVHRQRKPLHQQRPVHFLFIDVTVISHVNSLLFGFFIKHLCYCGNHPKSA